LKFEKKIIILGSSYDITININNIFASTLTLYKMISSIEPVLMKNVGFENYWSFRVLKITGI
jgi:hypothetical protein